jgi:FkbM family methyltransferase
MSDALARLSYPVSIRLLQERGFDVRTVIDVGAAEGAFFVVRAHQGLFPRARHFFVDAMRENEAIYQRLGSKFGTGHEITALSSMDGEVVLRVDPNFYNTHIDHLQPQTGYAERRRVPVCTLDALVERHGLQPPFLLKVDVQGGELDVLRGGLRTLEDAVIVTTEIQVFSERDTLVDLLSFMQGAGWALYDLTDLSHYPSDGTFHQCYATFIPRSMDNRRDIAWCQPEQQEEAFAQLRQRRDRFLKLIDEMLKGR